MRRPATWAGLGAALAAAAVITSCSAPAAVVVGQRPASEHHSVLGAVAAPDPEPEPDRGTASVPEPAPNPNPTPTPPTATTAPGPSTTLLGTVPAGLDQLTPTAGPHPVSVSVDPIGISGPVEPVGVLADTGELAVPPTAGVVGWYQYGPSPGQTGSAVLAGHVDWRGATGVFFRLGQVAVGSSVTIGLDDGTTRAFRVVERRLVLKPELPVDEVFARTGPPSLVLVTCGGEFDRSRHRYRSNVVIVATPVRG